MAQETTVHQAAHDQHTMSPAPDAPSRALQGGRL